ncbi:hypothetical protein [Mesorhizobium sp.]|uniref:hypothetical protein n=1 Tax=Mesorhizobium sp. TaxID=1871066 RepID=UPI000FE8C2F9|nr:hypothetical protein [Mesorhizobium sp.]RWQ58819.1 MAG: hypothetical protein EOS83_12500 [Mesorhizobium sp.]
MKQFLIATLVAASTFCLAGTASADSPWMTKADAKHYADVYLGKSADVYPTAIECKMVDGKIMIRFQTRSGKKPFKKWQFTVSSDPLAELQKINSGYRIVSSSNVRGRKCGLAYR